MAHTDVRCEWYSSFFYAIIFVLINFGGMVRLIVVMVVDGCEIDSESMHKRQWTTA